MKLSPKPRLDDAAKVALLNFSGINLARVQFNLQHNMMFKEAGPGFDRDVCEKIDKKQDGNRQCCSAVGAKPPLAGIALGDAFRI